MVDGGYHYTEVDTVQTWGGHLSRTGTIQPRTADSTVLL